MIAVVAAIVAAAPAWAGETGQSPDLWLPPLPPADRGKPLIAMPPPGADPLPDPPRCPPALPCGTRLLGVVQKNGAIELKVPALRW